MFEAIKKVLSQDYNHETPDVPRSKDFNRVYRAFIKKQVKPYGYELVNGTNGFCECSGFVTNGNGKYVYYSSGDYRFPNQFNDIFESVLIRTAESEKDYRGGYNHFVKLKDIGAEIDRLMK